MHRQSGIIKIIFAIVIIIALLIIFNVSVRNLVKEWGQKAMDGYYFAKDKIIQAWNYIWARYLKTPVEFVWNLFTKYVLDNLIEII